MKQKQVVSITLYTSKPPRVFLSRLQWDWVMTGSEVKLASNQISVKAALPRGGDVSNECALFV